VVFQAVDAVFMQDFHIAYRIRFEDIRRDVSMAPDPELFFHRLKESLKITLNNLERLELFRFYVLIDELAPGVKNQELQDVFFLMWQIFFPDESWQDENYRVISLLY
jgi:hypothetical protein